jgi:hypothetical protein
VEKFAPFKTKGLALGIVRAPGYRGGADSSVEFAPCQGPFFALIKTIFQGISFNALHGMIARLDRSRL